MPTHQWTRLSKPPFSYLDTLSRIDKAIDHNADIGEAILDASLKAAGLPRDEVQPIPGWAYTAKTAHMDEARKAINQLYRDWTVEGKVERDACYGPVLQYLSVVYLPGVALGERVKVLVPGAGLGRLVFELYCKGFDAEGIELSWHQWLTSKFILNHTGQANEWSLHPWVFSFSNHLMRNSQLREVPVPDVRPAEFKSGGSIHMGIGDFCQLYRGSIYLDTFDAVTTVFFIDTAPNLITYIETVRHCLKPGGVWINNGPLLWGVEHTEVEKDEDEAGASDCQSNKVVAGSLELSEDEVVALVLASGFHLVEHEVNTITTGYVQNPQSMLQSVYKPSYWVAMKL